MGSGRAGLRGVGRRTHVGDDGDEGVGDGEGQGLGRAELEAVLHEGQAVLPAEQAHVAEEVQRDLHILSRGRKQEVRIASAQNGARRARALSFHSKGITRYKG